MGLVRGRVNSVTDCNNKRGARLFRKNMSSSKYNGVMAKNYRCFYVVVDLTTSLNLILKFMPIMDIFLILSSVLPRKKMNSLNVMYEVIGSAFVNFSKKIHDIGD